MENQHHRKRIVALGEVLWDTFEDKKRLGGAPLNFAFHASQFGHEAHVVSRVGDDTLGDQLLTSVRQLGLGTDHIQIDPDRPTGAVKVSVNLFGEPRFEIARDSAWDYIEATEAEHRLVRSANVVWYNTLGQRSEKSRAAIRSLLQTARSEPRNALTLYELGLRQQFYSPQLIRESMEFCQVLRLSDDEFQVIKGMFGRSDAADRAFAVELMNTFALLMICITRSARGCIIHTPDAEVHAPGFDVEVVDTVGAGRAFTAAMVAKLLEGAPFGDVARFANLAGAYVATQHGATPRFTPYTLHQFEMNLEGKR